MLCEAPGVIYGNEELRVKPHISYHPLEPWRLAQLWSNAALSPSLLLVVSVPAAIIHLFCVLFFNLWHAWKVKSVSQHVVLLACIHDICTIIQVSSNSNVTTFCGLTVCHDWFSSLLLAAMFLCFHHHLYLSDKWRENSTEQYHPHTVSMNVHSVLIGAAPVCGVKCPLLVTSHPVGDGSTSLSGVCKNDLWVSF